MTLIVAEIGVNHDGDVRKALALIEAAQKAGANAVKFQTYEADILEPPGPRRDMLRRLQLPRAAHFELKNHAGEYGLEFLSTPFDVGSLNFLCGDLGVGRIKISSGGLGDRGLLSAAEEWRRPIILSTGMASMGDVAKAVRALKYATDLTLLHCVSAYPAPIDDMNLSAMNELKQFGCRVGLSDHSRSMVLPAAAVAMGASVIEVHLTLNSNAPGPDHKASLEPYEFKRMVDNVREVERAMGDGIKGLRPSEMGTMEIIKLREAFCP